MSKPALSGRVLGLKFMQKANHKKELLLAEEQLEVEKEREKVEEKNTSAPTVMQIEAAGSSKRCTVIYENAPQASSIGRFKFSARSPAEAEAEASAAELEKKKAKASAKLKDEVEELTVSDADLAKAFRRGPAARTSEDDAAGVRRKKQRAN